MIATIDFEASGFLGYPVEVGVAFCDPDHSGFVSVWSSLIQPTAGWGQSMEWSSRAEAIHGVSRSQLRDAPPAEDVARVLNRLLGPVGVAYCDGGGLDERWLFLLMQEIGEPCCFVLHGLGELGRHIGVAPSALLVTGGAHRAGADAERLVRRALELRGTQSSASVRSQAGCA